MNIPYITKSYFKHQEGLNVNMSSTLPKGTLEGYQTCPNPDSSNDFSRSSSSGLNFGSSHLGRVESVKESRGSSLRHQENPLIHGHFREYDNHGEGTPNRPVEGSDKNNEIRYSENIRSENFSPPNPKWSEKFQDNPLNKAMIQYEDPVKFPGNPYNPPLDSRNNPIPNFNQFKEPPMQPPHLGKPPDLGKLSMFIVNGSEVIPPTYPDEENKRTSFNNLNQCLMIQNKENPIIPPPIFYDPYENFKEEQNITMRASVFLNIQGDKNYSKVIPPFNFPVDENNIKEIQLNGGEDVDIDQNVSTISPFWIRIDRMKEIAKYNQDFTFCIDRLNHMYFIRGWKKSRGDGNCYYRAVISRYLELIFGFYSPLSNCRFFLQLLKNLQNKNYTFFDFQDNDSLIYALKVTEDLIKLKEQYPYYAFHSLLLWFQDTKVDQAFVRVARWLAYSEFVERQAEYLDFIDNSDKIVNEILTDKTEAESLVLLLLPAALKIQVHQFNIFSKDRMIVIVDYPEGQNFNIQVNVIRRPGHYDILYTSAEQESDMYCFETASYYFINA